MRFESFTFEKYGRADSRTLFFPPGPGLAVIYGPNEAGKSTSLAAISDFLFGIPHNSPRGQVFGYDQMRLSAIVALADGTRLSLRRRKGRAGRTLADESGQGVDEDVLARHLGSTKRERFCSLFGLDHNSLRIGGERLLAADGDIGRLIVEAGGGLRALLEAIGKMAQDADALFATKSAGHRRFYRALDAYHAADSAAKEGLLTLDAFVETKRRCSEAQVRVEEIRSKQMEIGENISRLQRLVRVIPTIRELDGADGNLAAFVDLPPLGDGFADAAQEALQALKMAEAALSEAKERHAALAAKIDTLVPTGAILAVEASIRDIKERVVHVRKARTDRANRQSELAEINAKLDVVRGALGLSPDADLEAMLPPPDALARVQKFAAQGLEQRARVAAIEDQLANEDRTLADLAIRQSERRKAGTSEPLGVTIADFATLAEFCGKSEGEERRAEHIGQEIAERVTQLGFEDSDCFAAWVCPNGAMIQSELDRRSRLEGEIAKIAEKFTAESEKRDLAAGKIEHLLRTREIPTDASIARARADREQTWQAIRDRYLSERGEDVARRPIENRQADVDRHRQQTEAADNLADRKSLEAERVAALEVAQRQKAEALILIESLEKQRTALDEQWRKGVRAWEEAWPDAVNRQADLGRLKALAEERGSLLEHSAKLREVGLEILRLRAEMAPRRLALEHAEAELAVEAGASASIAERVAAASKAIKIHDDAYADFRHDDKAIRDVSLRRQNTKASLDALQSAGAGLRTEWAPAASALGLAESIEPERANEIATQWATAAGLLHSLKLIRGRLRRMDDDENELHEKIESVACTLDFVLPEDGVAAGVMLAERLETELKIASERQVLAVQLKEAIAEQDRKQRCYEAAQAKVAGLCGEAKCEPTGLEALALRSRQRSAARDRRLALAETVRRSGDNLPLDILREQSAGRDLDNIKADLDQAEKDSKRLNDEMENALSEREDRTRAMEKFSATGGINEAVAARESAVAEMHDALERYVEISLAKDLLSAAMDKIRAEQQNPLIVRASALFSASTKAAFGGIETDIDEHGNPVVVGRRASGERVFVAQMSDGARDQLFLAFRIASIEQYCAAAEPLPFIADDLLVHFDDDRGAAALGLLAELGKTTQVMLFTHHRHVRKDTAAFVARNAANIIDLASA
ncbi:MAG: AAA family ATPase [Beijerinckiaceae bacterium]